MQTAKLKYGTWFYDRFFGNGTCLGGLRQRIGRGAIVTIELSKSGRAMIYLTLSGSVYRAWVDATDLEAVN